MPAYVDRGRQREKALTILRGARAGRGCRGEDEGFSGYEARSITPLHAVLPGHMLGHLQTMRRRFLFRARARGQWVGVGQALGVDGSLAAVGEASMGARIRCLGSIGDWDIMGFESLLKGKI